MTAPVLTTTQSQQADAVAREIGAAFRAARIRAGETQTQVGARIGMASYTEVTVFERQPSRNMMLSKALRMLNAYGLTLVVVPIADAAPLRIFK
jgi:transcriptional regulator with XRE-family HTH domain